MSNKNIKDTISQIAALFSKGNNACNTPQPPKCDPEPKIKCDPQPPKCDPQPPKYDPKPQKCDYDPKPPKCDPQPPKFDPKPQKCDYDPKPPKCDPQPPKCEPQQPKCEPQPPKCEPQPPKCDPQPPRCEPQPPKCDPQPPKCDPKPDCKVEAKSDSNTVFESGLKDCGDCGDKKPTEAKGNLLCNDNLKGEACITSICFEGKEYKATNGIICVDTDLGKLTVFTKDGDGHKAGDYIYKLENNSCDGDKVKEVFKYTLESKECADLKDTAELTIKVVDAEPKAENDPAQCVLGCEKKISGNVLANDCSVDDIRVKSFTYNNGCDTAYIQEGKSTTVCTKLGGILTVNSNGEWCYTSPKGAEKGCEKISDGFEYTIIDCDGDKSSACQPIEVKFPPPPEANDDCDTVFESGLKDCGDCADKKPTEVRGNLLCNDNLKGEACITNICFNGKNYNAVNGLICVDTDLGKLTVFTKDGDGHKAGDYIYKLENNSCDGDKVKEVFKYTLESKECADLKDTAELTIKVVDAEPKAENDPAQCVLGCEKKISGNVLANDCSVDDIRVKSFTYNNGCDTAYIQEGKSTTVCTKLGGILTVNSNGEWCYTSPKGAEKGCEKISDGFEYTIIDCDGDKSSACQPIEVKFPPPPEANDDCDTVFESGLKDCGDCADKKPTEVRGNLLCNDNLKGEACITNICFNGKNYNAVNGLICVDTDLGKLTVFTKDGDGHKAGDYIYKLENNSCDGDKVKEVFKYTLESKECADLKDTAELTIKVVDAEPKAENDPAQCVLGCEKKISGNVLANDCSVDDIRVKSFTYNNGCDTAYIQEGKSTTVCTKLGGILTVNSNGEWCYTSPKGAEKGCEKISDGFEYTIIDCDGDKSSACQPIEVKFPPPPEANDDCDTVFESGLKDCGDCADKKPTEVRGNLLCNDNLKGEACITNICFNGKNYNAVNGLICVDTDLGKLTVFTKDGDGHKAGDYIYKLENNSCDGDKVKEVFKYTLESKECADLKDTAELTIKVVDAEPKAENDPAQCVLGCEKKISGNVLANDCSVDDIRVKSFTYNNGCDTAYIQEGKSTTVCTKLGGILTVNSNGEWCYTSPKGAEKGCEKISDGFEYTIIDCDGDKSSACQPIEVKFPPPPEANDDCDTVFESGLKDCGDCADKKPTEVRGNLLCNDNLKGEACITNICFNGKNYNAVNGLICVDTDLGKLTVFTKDGDGHKAGDYIYKLENNSCDGDKVKEVFKYTLESKECADLKDTAELTIKVVDAEPKAENDPAQCVLGCEKKISGNVLANDCSVDDIRVKSFTYNNGCDTAYIQEGKSTTVCTKLGGILTVNSNGEWCYTSPKGAEKGCEKISDGFEYTIIDCDGDKSSACQPIEVKFPPPPEANDDCDTVFESGLKDCGDCADKKPTEVRGNLLCNDNLKGEACITNICFNGKNYNAVNGLICVDTDLGKLTVFTKDGDGHKAGDYIYKLENNSCDGDKVKEVFKYTLESKECADLKDTAELTIKVVDAEPKAVNDPAQCVLGCEKKISGNVLANDCSVDDIRVKSFTYDNGKSTAYIQEGKSITVCTKLGGILTVNSNGEWCYTSPKGAEKGCEKISDGFEYTIIDCDGDKSSACQPIEVKFPPPPEACDDKGFTVFESGLACGSDNDTNNPCKPAEPKPTCATGNVLANDKICVPAAITKVCFDGKDFAPNNKGIITINTGIGTLTLYTKACDGKQAGDFKYELKDNACHPDDKGNNDILQKFSYTLENIDDCGKRSADKADLFIKIVDDVPKAIDDPAQCVEGCNKKLTGNVLCNDVLGADKAKVTSFTYDNGKNCAIIGNSGSTTVTTMLGSLLTVFSNGDWCYITPKDLKDSCKDGKSAQDGFTYTIADKDGDKSVATQPISVKDIDKPQHDPKPPHHNDNHCDTACDRKHDRKDHHEDRNDKDHKNNHDKSWNHNGNQSHGEYDNKQHGKNNDHTNKPNDQKHDNNDQRGNDKHDRCEEKCDDKHDKRYDRDGHKDKDHDNKHDWKCDDKNDKHHGRDEHRDNNHHNNKHDDKCDDKHDNRDNHNSKGNDCDEQCYKGNVFECDSNEHTNKNDGASRVSCFKYYNECNEFVECKAGSWVTTKQGGKLVIYENGHFSYEPGKHGKSFNEFIECSTIDCNNKHGKSSLCIHTPDICPDFDNHHQNSGWANHDYIVDASEVCPKETIFGKDLGLNALDFKHVGNGCSQQSNCLLETVLHSNNGNSCNKPCESHCAQLPPTVNDMCSVDQHVQNAMQEVHVIK